jgi:peptidoglycan hydrolase-like protein with peptidoglycan-binding domain
MKKIVTILVVCLLGTSTSFAQSFGEIGTETLNSFYGRILQTQDANWRNAQINKVISELQKLLINSNTSVSVSTNSNSNFTGPYTFGEVSGTGAVQKVDPNSGINYYLYPTITGNAPLTVKFTPGAGHTISYGDGTDSASLREGSFDELTGYRFNQGQISTHTYTVPGRYVANEYGLTPSGKRAEVVIVVTGNDVSSNSNCQKLTQTLWQGQSMGYDRSSTISYQTSISALNKFLVKLGLANNGISGNVQADQEWQTSFGQKTVDAVKLFQSQYGIKQTGSVGPVTMSKINSMICGSTSGKSQNYSQLPPATYYDDFNFDGLQDKLVIVGLGSGKIYVQTSSGNYVLSEELNKILYLGERGYFNLNYSDKTIETGGSMGGGQYNKKTYKVIPGVGLKLISDTTTTN